MEGYSPKLPLQPDQDDGLYKMNKSAVDSIKQNFKNLLLTDPGERIMNSDFGVGLKRFLFSQYNSSLEELIKSRIIQQTSKYISYIEIIDILLNLDENNENVLEIAIKYYIPSIRYSDIIFI